MQENTAHPGPCCTYHETGGASFDECADANAAEGDTAKTREQLVEEILAHYDEPEGDNNFDPKGKGRYLLVEQSSRYRGRRWFTWHDTMKEAADYHLCDECREDWDELDLWDTETGEQFEPVYGLEWV